MKKILMFLLVFSSGCSATESSGWVSNLLTLKNANYVTDNAGTITMDGFTYTLESVKSSTTAIYRVHVGEFDNKESESIGFCRFDIIGAALTDSRIREPLLRYQMRTTPEEALSAPKMNAGEILAVPQEVTDERFLRTVRNLTNRGLQTNGANMGEPSLSVNDNDAAEGAKKLYLIGNTASDGTNIYFEEVGPMTDLDAARPIPKAYYRDAQWSFVKALNNSNAVYQKVKLAKTNLGNAPDGTPYFDANPARPLREFSPLQLEAQFAGVQNKADGLYFIYPSNAPDSFFPSAEAVSFGAGYTVKVSRPINAGDAP